MPASRARPVLVVALLVLSGCSAPVGTPAGTPTDDGGNATTTTPTLDDVDLPPGVRADRTVPGPLVAAHLAALREVSHTVVRQVTVRTPAGNRTDRTVARFGGDGRIAVTRRVRTPAVEATVETYVGEDRVYRRVIRNGSTHYRVRPATRDAVVAERRRVSSVAVVRSLLRAGNFSPAGVRLRNGTTLVVLRATAVRPDGRPGGGNVSTLDATMLATERGVVREVSVVPGDESSRRRSFTLRVEAVGRTTVTRPAWLGAARRAANQTTAGST